MRRILRLMVPLLCGILLSFAVLLSGCATVQPIQPEQSEEMKSARISNLVIPVENRTINDMYFIPTEIPMLETMIPKRIEDIYTQFIIVVYGGDTVYGLIFDKYDFTLVGIGAVGNKYLDLSGYGKAWIYPEHGLPVECTWAEQDAWLLELDYELSKKNRKKI